DPQDFPLKEDFSCDLLIDENDYVCLNSDLAENLLAGLSELSDLPVIDQSTLDEAFIAPSRRDLRCIQPWRDGGGQGGGSAGAAAIFSCPSSHSLSSSEPSIFPKMNIHHHPPNIPSLTPYHNHHPRQILPPNSSAMFSRGQYFTQGMMRDLKSTPLPPSSACSFRKDSLMDMHSYSISVDENTDGPGVGNLTNLCMNRVGPPNLPSKCIKAYSKTLLGPTGKLNVQALHHSHATKKGTACFSSFQSAGLQPSFSSRQQNPKIIPITAEEQHLMSSHMLTGSSTPGMSSGKGRSHNVVPAKFSPQAYSVKSSSNLISPASSCSRFYPQHGGLGSSSPLITSLAPLRNVKYQGQINTRLYSSSPCSMMPYRPRLQLADTSSIGTSSLCHRRSAHTVPISTTLNTFATARAQGGNVQQIKVCLPTQALKIPIAKLRGGKKSTYIKGKLKNVGLPPPSPDTVGNISCIPQQGCKTTPGVLAKVLSFQVKNEACASTEYRSPIITDISYTSPKISSTTSTFIGTMRPMTSQLDCYAADNSGYRNSKKVQLVSVDSRGGYNRPVGSTHTAVIVSPMSVHKRSSAGCQYQYSSTTNAMSTFKTTSSLTSSSTVVTTASFDLSPEHMSSLHMNPSLYNSRYLSKNSLTTTKSKRPRVSSVHSRSERSLSMKPNPISFLEDDDECNGSQFVVVGTRTTCLPIPKKRSEPLRADLTHAAPQYEISTENSAMAVQSHYWCAEDMPRFIKNPDACKVDEAQLETPNSMASHNTRFHDNCNLQPVALPSSETKLRSVSNEVLCIEGSHQPPIKTPEKVIKEKNVEDGLTDVFQTTKRCNNVSSSCEFEKLRFESNCQNKSILQPSTLGTIGHDGDAYLVTSRAKSCDQTAKGPTDNPSMCENEIVSKVVLPEGDVLEVECVKANSKDKQIL
ncbi:hypothetical protein EGW08_016786, partial [Elysia chlorotica]